MDDVILNKTKSLEKCLLRVREEYQLADGRFGEDFSHQDAAILNLQRACELSIDLANYLIKKHDWGLPESSRDGFQILCEQKLLPQDLAEDLKKMVGFRNLAVHDYGSLSAEILENIINNKLDTFTRYIEILLKSTG